MAALKNNQKQQHHGIPKQSLNICHVHLQGTKNVEFVINLCFSIYKMYMTQVNIKMYLTPSL